MNYDKRFLFYLILVFFLSFLVLTVGFVFYLYLILGLGILFFTVLKGFFIWGSVVLISCSFLLFALYFRYLRYRRHVQVVSSNLLSAIEHRFGNFLSNLKLNITLLELSSDIKSRVEKSIQLFEGDFRQILLIVKHLFFQKENASNNCYKIIYNALQVYQKLYPSRSVKTRILSCNFAIPEIIFETMFDIILSNAFKYSKQLIYIRSGIFKNRFYLAVKNDFSSKNLSGSGLGIRILEELCREYDFIYRYKRKDRCFICLLVGPKRSFTIFSQNFF